MLVKCQPLYENDDRETCGRIYDDEFRWTICPHKNLDQDPREKP